MTDTEEFLKELIPPPAVEALKRKAEGFGFTLREWLKEELYTLSANQIANEIADAKFDAVFSARLAEAPRPDGGQDD